MSGNLKTFRIALVVFLTFFVSNIYAQALKGTVKDSAGEPVIGATVVEKGSPKNAAVTNFDGVFNIKVAAGKTLVISYVGMKTQEVKAANNMVVVMEDDAALVDEVVVVGYTSKARKDLTGSVGSISGKKLEAVPVSSAAEALQGKIAGVQITTVDGQPGADINIRVRGATSVTQGNQPLFIVDGFIAPNINDIPPSDIASIDVLKDASLTAIYGAKGANGVVIVTTKAAKEGKVTVSFNGRLSVSSLAKSLDLMDAQEFARYSWDRAAAGSTRSSATRYFRNNFGNQNDLDLYSRATTHDWQDEVMGENPINYSANVTVGGGSDKLRFNASLTQTEDKGIIMGSGVRRTNLNIKFDVKLSDNLTLKINPKFTYRRDEGAGGNNIGSGGIIDVLKYRPTNGLREFAHWDPATVDPDEEANFAYTNPKNDIQTNTQKKHSYQYVNQISLQWQPIEGLMLRSDFAHRLTFADQQRFFGPLTKEGTSNYNLPVVQLTDNKTESYVWTNTASYNFTINDDHEFSALLGQEISSSQKKQDYVAARYFPKEISADQAINNMALGTPYSVTSSLSTPDRMASFFGQVSYNYADRYLASFTMRADGSTKFAPGNQWGYFPSISAGWVISEEPFMKDIEWINQLKIRAAYGLSGNNNLSDDMWRYLYTINSSGGPGFGESTEFGEKYYSAAGGSQLPNPEIKWETTTTTNIAADISLFDNRLTITPEIYWKKTTDLIYKSDIITSSGYATQMQNIGETSNKGFELTVNGDILRGKDYVLSANFTFGMNKMKVEKLNSTDNIIWDQNDRWKSSFNDYCLKVGDEVGLIYGFVYDGLYGTDEFTYDPNQNFLAVPHPLVFDENGKYVSGTILMGEGTTGSGIFNDSQSGVATLPGKIKFKDLNGDGHITEADRTVIGNTNPKYQGGFGLNGQWKDFDFTANFTYMLDFDINNATAYALSSSSSSSNQFTNVLSKFNDAWKYTRESDKENMYKNYYLDKATDEYISMNAGKTLWNPADITNNVTHSYFIEDGSFLRCSDITIGYTLPNKLTSKWGMSKLRFYASCSNLFIITDYSGYDPEVDIQTGLTCGMDYNRYPRSRSFVFGVNMNF